MSYINITDRNPGDLVNASTDINVLIDNQNYILEKVYNEILLEIEMMKVLSVLCDPLNIPTEYLICDGSDIPSDSEAYIIHNTGGTISKDSFSKEYATVFGRSKIPNLLGFHSRFQAIGSSYDPDRATRRQLATGTVNTKSGVIVYFPKYYINLIKEAVDNSRTVIIANGSVGIFGTKAIYGTVSAVNDSLNYVTLTSITGTFTAGEQSLILEGDLLGSFQNDAMQRMTGTLTQQGNRAALTNACTGVFTVSGTKTSYAQNDSGGTIPTYVYFDSATSISPNTAKTSDYETHSKNIALLPLVRVYL